MFNENWFVRNLEKKIFTNKFLSCQDTNTRTWHEKCSISLWRRWNGDITHFLCHKTFCLSFHFSYVKSFVKVVNFVRMCAAYLSLNYIWRVKFIKLLFNSLWYAFSLIMTSFMWKLRSNISIINSMSHIKILYFSNVFEKTIKFWLMFRTFVDLIKILNARTIVAKFSTCFRFNEFWNCFKMIRFCWIFSFVEVMKFERLNNSFVEFFVFDR